MDNNLMPVKIRPATGAGSVALEAANGVSTDFTLTLPGTTGTVLVSNSSSQTLFPDGTLSAPSISNDGDPNTGIYFPAADTIGFVEGGAESMRLDASGNMGLGVTPSAWSGAKVLQIGNTSIANYAATNSVYGTNYYYDGSNLKYISNGNATYYQQTGGLHSWFNAASGVANNNISFTQAMTLDASGKLLIGVTSAQGTALQVTAAGYAGDPAVPSQIMVQSTEAYNATPSAGITFWNKYNSSGNYAGMGGLNVVKSNTTDGDLGSYMAFYTRPSGSPVAERARIDQSGNVGIGNTSPTEPLTIGPAVTSSQFSIRVNGSLCPAYYGAFQSQAYIGANRRMTDGAIINSSYGTAYVALVTSTDGANILFNTSSAANTQPDERMRIDTSGNLLVGTTTELFRLSIAGPATSKALSQFYSNTAGDVSNPAIQIVKTDNNNTTSQKFITFLINTGGSGSGQINANGAAAAAFGSYSDIRLKENITPLPSQLSNILALKPSEFDYRDGSGHQIGFIAQEMQEVYPDVVGEGDDGMLTITGWSKTEARLVKAIQELAAKNADLEARLAALESK